MRKNQKNVPYTFSALMIGNRVAAQYHTVMIDKISEQIVKERNKARRENRKPETSELEEKLRYNRAQLEYFNDEYARFSLARLCCDDATVMIR